MPNRFTTKNIEEAVAYTGNFNSKVHCDIPYNGKRLQEYLNSKNFVIINNAGWFLFNKKDKNWAPRNENIIGTIKGNKKTNYEDTIIGLNNIELLHTYGMPSDRVEKTAFGIKNKQYFDVRINLKGLKKAISGKISLIKPEKGNELEILEKRLNNVKNHGLKGNIKENNLESPFFALVDPFHPVLEEMFKNEEHWANSKRAYLKPHYVLINSNYVTGAGFTE